MEPGRRLLPGHSPLSLQPQQVWLGQVPGHSGHRWRRGESRQEVAAAQAVSAQSTAHCLDSRENVTDVACYRIFKPVGPTYLCLKFHCFRAIFSSGSIRMFCR